MEMELDPGRTSILQNLDGSKGMFIAGAGELISEYYAELEEEEVDEVEECGEESKCINFCCNLILCKVKSQEGHCSVVWIQQSISMNHHSTYPHRKAL
jgi:hypothetical protein